MLLYIDLLFILYYYNNYYIIFFYSNSTGKEKGINNIYITILYHILSGQANIFYYIVLKISLLIYNYYYYLYCRL